VKEDKDRSLKDQILVIAPHEGLVSSDTWLKSPLLVAVRNVGYADALVSMMSLQAALLVSFGDGEPDPRLMNGISGAAVCGTVSLIGIYMIYSSGRQKRNE